MFLNETLLCGNLSKMSVLLKYLFSVKVIFRIYVLLYFSTNASAEVSDCANERRRPSVVFITTNEDPKILCSGALLDSQWVLTIAECFRNVNNDLEIHLGNGMSMSIVPVSLKVLHPAYKESLENNVALLQLKTPVLEDETIKYATLPKRTLSELSSDGLPTEIQKICPSGIGVGWSSTDKYSGQFVCTELKTISLEECQNKTYMNFFHNVICSEPEQNDYECRLDWGSPLICNGVQYGITGFGVKCSESWKPKLNLHLRVDEYIEFINSRRNIKAKNHVLGLEVQLLPNLMMVLLCIIMLQ